MQNEKLAAVGRLASSIAHEINNPLEPLQTCSISLWVAWILQKSRGYRQRHES